jgi:hypothetical protein
MAAAQSPVAEALRMKGTVEEDETLRRCARERTVRHARPAERWELQESFRAPHFLPPHGTALAKEHRGFFRVNDQQDQQEDGLSLMGRYVLTDDDAGLSRACHQQLANSRDGPFRA